MGPLLGAGANLMVRRLLVQDPVMRGQTVEVLDVLVLEDDELVRRTVARALGLRGHRLRLAASSKEAERLICEDAPDVLLADYALGEGTSEPLLLRLAREWPGIWRVLYSSHGSALHKRLLAARVVHRALDKSSSLVELWAAVEGSSR
jgi:DNA-binding NtrC family response regulator